MCTEAFLRHGERRRCGKGVRLIQERGPFSFRGAPGFSHGVHFRPLSVSQTARGEPPKKPLVGDVPSLSRALARISLRHLYVELAVVHRPLEDRERFEEHRPGLYAQMKT